MVGCRKGKTQKAYYDNDALCTSMQSVIKSILTMRIVPSHCISGNAWLVVFVVNNKGTKEQSEIASQEQCAPTN